MIIVGRKKERQIIKQCYESMMSEFVALYGRRGIGKTYLINSSFDNKFDFTFTAFYHATTSELLNSFQLEINKLTNKNENTPKTWYEVLENLKTYLLSLNKEKVLVFIDELPWLDTMRSNFMQSFSRFINTWNSNKCLLKLYVCGSNSVWMINTLIGDKGGLYGRITRQIHLSPFNLEETEEYINKVKKINLSKKQILDLYMIMGGVSYYLNMVNFDYPISKNIDELFFDENGPLRKEFNFLFESLFKNSINYKKVIKALSTKLNGLTREEISQITQINGGYLTQILDNLKKCDFLKCYKILGKNSKGMIYQLVDLYSLFYLHFIEEGDGQDSSYWSHTFNSPKVNTWRGYAFLQICLIHINQIKKELGIAGILANVYSWKENGFIDSMGNAYSGGQIDLIIDRNDQMMNLCEIKYSSDVYYITKEYENKIRNRNQSFIHSIKTKKSIINTFISINGVSKSDIVDREITFECLFE